MFQRVPRSPEITRLRGSGNLKLRFKLTATIDYGSVSSVGFFFMQRLLQLPSWREAWPTQAVPQLWTEAASQWSHRNDYPVPSKMAVDILSISLMSAKLERAFFSSKKA
jgi:hypothetical protein